MSEQHLSAVVSELIAWLRREWAWLSVGFFGMAVSARWSWKKYTESTFATKRDLDEHEQREIQRIDEDKDQIMRHLHEMNRRDDAEHEKLHSAITRVHERLDHIHDIIIENMRADKKDAKSAP